MKTFYELMDLSTANVVGFYDVEEDALAVVRSAFERYGWDGVADLALSRKVEGQPAILVADGGELVQRALGSLVIPSASSV